MGLLKEQCEEKKKAPLPYCCNQVWMKIGGQILWNVTPICETSQIYYLMGRRPMKDVLGKHLKDRSFHLFHGNLVSSAVEVNPMGKTTANGWSGAVPSRARRKTASPVARSLLTLFLLITQSERVEVCGGQGLCTALSYVALAGSECMIGDVMRIQRTPRSMPAVFSPCIQTQGPRLYKERVTAVRKPMFLGVKWFGNATAVSSHDSLLVSNGDGPLEFNWCVLVKLPRLFLRFGFRRCAKHGCQLFLLYSLVRWRSHPSCCRVRKPRFWVSYGSANATAVSTHDSLLVPQRWLCLGVQFNWCVKCGVNYCTNSLNHHILQWRFQPLHSDTGSPSFLRRACGAKRYRICLPAGMHDEGIDDVRSIWDGDLGGRSQTGVSPLLAPYTSVARKFATSSSRSTTETHLVCVVRHEMKWNGACFLMWRHTREKFVWAAMITPLLLGGRKGENTALSMCKDNTSKDPFSQCESLQGIHVQVRNWIKWYSDNNLIGDTKCRAKIPTMCVKWFETLGESVSVVDANAWTIMHWRSSVFVVSLFVVSWCRCPLIVFLVRCTHTLAQVWVSVHPIVIFMFQAHCERCFWSVRLLLSLHLTLHSLSYHLAVSCCLTTSTSLKLWINTTTSPHHACAATAPKLKSSVWLVRDVDTRKICTHLRPLSLVSAAWCAASGLDDHLKSGFERSLSWMGGRSAVPMRSEVAMTYPVCLWIYSVSSRDFSVRPVGGEIRVLFLPPRERCFFLLLGSFLLCCVILACSGVSDLSVVPKKTEIARSARGPKLQGHRAEDALAEPYLEQKILVTW